LTDSRYVQVTRKVDAKQIELPMYERVMEKIGKPVVFNICVLGALIGITEVVRAKSVMEAVADRVPKDFIDLNNRAFDLGLVLGAQYGSQELVRECHFSPYLRCFRKLMLAISNIWLCLIFEKRLDLRKNAYSRTTS
jgi:hypothetical protein